MDPKEMDDLKPDEAERQELLPIAPQYDKNGEPNKRLPKIMSKPTGIGVEKRLPDPAETDREERDPIAQIIGNYGRWQLKMTFLLSLCSFPCTFHIFSPTFLAAPADFWCARPHHLRSIDSKVWRNFSQPKDACSILALKWSSINAEDFDSLQPPQNAELVPCKSWEWDTSFIGQTIISEWQLVCDRHYLNTIAEMLFLFGIGIGGVVSGVISDRFGRKKALIGSLVIQSVIGMSIVFCPWFELYLILRITLGFFSVAVVFSAFVLVVELVGGKWRTTAGVCNFFPLPVSYIVVAGLSLLLPDWRHLQLAISIPGILLISLWWVVPESPHWLLTTGRIVEVKEILHEAVVYNKRKLPTSLDKILQQPTMGSEDHAPGLLDLFRGPVRKITISIFVIWYATTIAYYGLVLNIASFGGELHITSMLSGLVELPAIALSIPILLKMGRRYPISLSLICAGVGCLAVSIIESLVTKQWVKITLLMISKFSVSSTNGVLPMFTAELYPTLMRNMGVGASQLSAGIGLVCIPYLWTLNTISTKLPMVLTGCMGVIGGLCVLLLPETANKSLTSVQYNDDERQSGAQMDNPVSNGPFTITDPKAS